MVKFYGKIGYSEGTVEVRPGVWKDIPVERSYYGDVIRNSRKLESDQKVNADISVGNSISIVADAYAYQHFFAIRYVSWQGALWIVSDVSVEPPRLVLRLGGKYDGSVPADNSATNPSPETG